MDGGCYGPNYDWSWVNMDSKEPIIRGGGQFAVAVECVASSAGPFKAGAGWWRFVWNQSQVVLGQSGLVNM